MHPRYKGSAAIPGCERNWAQGPMGPHGPIGPHAPLGAGLVPQPILAAFNSGRVGYAPQIQGECCHTQVQMVFSLLAYQEQWESRQAHGLLDTDSGRTSLLETDTDTHDRTWSQGPMGPMGPPPEIYRKICFSINFLSFF